MRVSNRCYAVTGLGYSTPWSVNAGFIVGDDITLVVDTGACAASAATIYGYATSVRSSNRLRVINTEKHFDHLLGNSYFQERGVEIWGHSRVDRSRKEFDAEVAEFNDAIPDRARRAAGEARAFFYGTELAMPEYLVECDVNFELGNCPVEILLTPGHTATNLSVWVPGDRVVYTGDCLINQYLPNLDAGGVEDWKIWLRSIERIEVLGARTVVAGHGAVAQGEDVGRVIERVRTVLREAIASGHSPTG
jgi:glyoxylase-like metal-dependent hydrolase (beta-lactamase superfamily II)